MDSVKWAKRCEELANMTEDQARAELARITEERRPANRAFMEKKRKVHEHYVSCAWCKGKTEGQVINHSGVKF